MAGSEPSARTLELAELVTRLDRPFRGIKSHDYREAGIKAPTAEEMRAVNAHLRKKRQAQVAVTTAAVVEKMMARNGQRPVA